MESHRPMSTSVMNMTSHRRNATNRDESSQDYIDSQVDLRMEMSNEKEVIECHYSSRQTTNSSVWEELV